MIIGIGGKKGSGKDTVGLLLQELLLEEGLKFTTVAFADKLKELIIDLFDMAEEQLYGLLKEFPDKRYPNKNGTFWTPRELMQYLGTDVFRGIYPNIWVDYLRRRIESSPGNYIITDCRFKNEVGVIKENNGLYLSVVRKQVGKQNFTTHVSENDLNHIAPDILIINNYNNIDDLRSYLKREIVPQLSQTNLMGEI